MARQLMDKVKTTGAPQVGPPIPTLAESCISRWRKTPRSLGEQRRFVSKSWHFEKQD
jgi:hypothetical protein